jgi:ABC-2 type transport system permease protein
MNQVLKLIRLEARLVLREPFVLAFVFAFPVVTVLVLAGSFDIYDKGFSGANPADWYIASYLAVVIAAVGLIMIPVHLASYRERGVLRRFTATGFPRWSFAVAQLVVGVSITLVGSAVLLAFAAAVYGLPPVMSPISTLIGIFLGAVAFTSVGLLLGSVMPNARAAQGVGLLVFFPSFLLAGGGPPPDAMSSGMRSVAKLLPLTHVTSAIRQPWLGLGGNSFDLAILGGLLVLSALGWRKVLAL